MIREFVTIMPTQALIGVLTDQDYFITESYGLTLIRTLTDIFNLSLASSIDRIVTNAEELKPYINWDYVMQQYNALKHVAPCKLDYDVVSRVYLRVFAALYITLQEYIYCTTLHCRQHNSSSIIVTGYSAISDGISITYTCDYLPF